MDEKRQLTVANRGKGGTKGRRREVVGSEAVACTDSVGLRHEAPFLTKLQPDAQLPPSALDSNSIIALTTFDTQRHRSNFWDSSPTHQDVSYAVAQVFRHSQGALHVGHG